MYGVGSSGKAIVITGRRRKRLAQLERVSGQPDGLVKIGDAFAYFDAVREKLLGQCADRVALIEDGLLLGVRLRDQVLGVVGVPEQFGTLKAPEKLRLGDVGRARIVSGTVIGLCECEGRAPRSGSGVTTEVGLLLRLIRVAVQMEQDKADDLRRVGWQEGIELLALLHFGNIFAGLGVIMRIYAREQGRRDARDRVTRPARSFCCCGSS